MDEVTAARRWRLVAAERDRLVVLVRARLSCPADVEDTVQEAMIRAATFDALDETRVSALLTTIAVRLCADHGRRYARDLRLVQRAGSYARQDAVAGDIAEHVCEASTGRWLHAISTDLAPREREVLYARAEGMTVAQVADLYRITPKSAESALARARARLRCAYQDAMAV